MRSSRFSRFIREASVEEKQRVYTEVLRIASEAQNAQIGADGRERKLPLINS